MLLSRCAPPSPGGHALFAIDSLLHAQATHLSKAQASLYKQIALGTKQEDVTIIPRDTTAWLKELEVFGVMNVINKPINRDRYQVSESGDTKSNLRVRTFSTSHDLPISYVRLYYHGQPGRIRKVEAAYTELNGLYKTSRLLALEFDDINGTPVMTSYSILGGQKMFLDDTVQYDIKGRVSLENR
ncbi:MAG TPA: hypothetical protein VK658_12950 [Chryseolinea sp.]|nr:hypothetical protein [Chryseolinea sp.]